MKKIKYPIPVIEHFSAKPILIGGAALAFHGVKPLDDDYDFIVSPKNFTQLQQVEDLKKLQMDDDLGLGIENFEFWLSIHGYQYDFWLEHAIDEEDFYVLSLEKLTFMTAMVADQPHYYQDLMLLINKIKSIK